MYKVNYNMTVSDSNSINQGYIISRAKKFYNFTDAIIFIRSLKNKKNIVGRPLIERIGGDDN